MAANPSKVTSVSSMDDNSNNKKELDAKAKEEASAAFSFDFSRLGPDVTKIIGQCQNSSQLALFSKITTFTHKTWSQSDLDSRYVTEKILPPVFNANPDGIKALFNKKAAPHPKLLLKKSSYQRGYFSQKQNKFICVERFKSVSAWQAAFLCADGPFLGLDILTYLIQDNSLSQEEKHLLVKEAREQLGELINRIPVKPIESNPVTTHTEAHTATPMPSIARTTDTISASNAPEPNTVNCKEKGEQNSITRSKTEFADSFEFLCHLRELIKAYNIYIAKYDLLAEKGPLTEEDWTVLDPLWENVGECQKRLPHCVLQYFCGPVPFYPLTKETFTTPPPRTECRGWHDKPLDLDSFGVGTFCALYNGWCVERALFGGGGAHDLEAIKRLCELRETHLRNTFNCLQTLESALTLIKNDKARLSMDNKSNNKKEFANAKNRI